MATDFGLPRRIVKRYLLDTEQVVVATRRHWAKIVPIMMLPITGLILVLVAADFAPRSAELLLRALWVLWLTTVIFAGWRILDWRNDWFIATDKRMLAVYGLITHQVAMMPISKVTDMSFEHSLPGRILGYGTFILESAGQDQAMSTIRWVPHPDETYRELCASLFGPSPSSSPAPDATNNADMNFGDGSGQIKATASSAPTQSLRSAVPAPTPAEPGENVWIVSTEDRAPFIPTQLPPG